MSGFDFVGASVSGNTIVPSNGVAQESTYAAAAALNLNIDGKFSSNRLAFAAAKAEVTGDMASITPSQAPAVKFENLVP